MGSGGFGWLWPLLIAGTCMYGSASSQPTEHSFLIVHKQSRKCLQAENDEFRLDNCSDTSNRALWQWGSSHRLYSLGTQKCLGLDLSKTSEPLKLVPCDSKPMLWWRCSGGHVYGAAKYGLSVKDGMVAAVLQSPDEWKMNDTSENICEVPYHVVYTAGGDSYGKPCTFPFLFNGTWYHDCIFDTNEDREWCFTSGIFDNDEKWGNCLKPVSDCNHTWTQNATLQQCYQFNMLSSLRWKEAYMSCKSQGADLLSITSEEELMLITNEEDLPDLVWIGLNRLESSSGWQWSDNSPLNFINWDKGVMALSVLDGSSCGRLNVNTKTWDVFACEASLPYICKKPMASSAGDPPDYWHHSETTCEGNWTAYNGFCYFLQLPDSWEDAELSCQKENGSLISLHSLADIELVVTKFQSENENIWSGFRSDSLPHLFKWSDGTEAHFTYWDQNEPLPPFNVTPSCVSFLGTTGRWHVRNCTEKYNSICKRPGKINPYTKSDSGCPQDKNWRRHGEYCYLVKTSEVTFDEKCDLTITNKFEQEFLNSLMRELTNSEKYIWTNLKDTDESGDYYWQTAAGKKDLSYSNWNTHEPAFPGGCVAMARGESLGKWEVKDCKGFKAGSICKKGIGSAKEEDIPKPSITTCPDGWFPGSEMYCYKVFHKERLLRQRTWEEAEGICEEFGGHLVSFTHLKEMREFHNFLKSRLSGKLWIWVGLNKRNLGSWEWSDGRPISSTVLDEFQREDYFLRDCAALEINAPMQRNVWTWHFEMIQEKEYSLQPFHCDAQLEWVCQVEKGVSPKTPQWYQPGWKPKMGSTLVDGSEYWFVSDSKLGHKAAELYCAMNGSELADIDTYNALIAVQDYLKNQGDALRQPLTQKWWVKSVNVRRRHQLILHHVLGRPYNECPFVSALSYFPDFFQHITCNENLPFVCKSQNISLLEIETSKPNNYTGSCPLNWTAFENKCFLKVPPRYLKFSEANDYCKKYGGLLPSISSQSIQDFITYLSSDLNQKFWIGLQSALKPATNSWIDGSSVSYTNFNPLVHGTFEEFQHDRYDADKKQQCVFFLNDPKSSFIGTWDFTTCSDLQYVTICQKTRDKAGTTVPIVVPEDVSYKEKTYKILQKNMTWYMALEECRSKNMELTSITDQYQLSFLIITVKQTGRPLWIGLSSRDDGMHYRWQDGSAITLNRWNENLQEDEDCVFMDVDGTWKTDSCDTELLGGICHVPANRTEKLHDGTIACPHKVQDVVWIPYRNNCYAFLLNHKRWLSNEHRYICHSLNPNAYALSIRNEEENWFIFNELRPYMDLARWVWLGLRYDEYENTLRWHDETFVKYSNWRTGRPNMTSNNFYAGMKLDGFWDIFYSPKDFDLMFYQQHSIVACKIEMGSTGEFSEPLPTFIPFANSTYYVLKKKLTWFEAVKECRQSDGNLASVHDNSQQLFLENIVRQDGYPLWIGLWNNNFEQPGSVSETEWSDGTSVNYAFGNPDRLLPRGNCIYFDTKGSWLSRSCTEPLDGALCYKSLKAKSRFSAADPLCPKADGSAQWVRQKDFCYAFDMKIYNYAVYTNEQASKMCQTLDPTAKLLTINDEEENEFVSKYLTDDAFLTHRVWLGVDSSSADQKSWLDGSPIKYNHWGSVQPRALSSCAVLLPPTGMWNRVPCTPGMGRIVCKSPLKSTGVGIAVGFAILIILSLIIGLVIYLYKRRHPLLFSSIRYRQADEQGESMIDYS